jgi:hypothetical protein
MDGQICIILMSRIVSTKQGEKRRKKRKDSRLFAAIRYDKRFLLYGPRICLETKSPEAPRRLHFSVYAKKAWVEIARFPPPLCSVQATTITRTNDKHVDFNSTLAEKRLSYGIRTFQPRSGSQYFTYRYLVHMVGLGKVEPWLQLISDPGWDDTHS